MKVKHRYFLKYGCREQEVSEAEYRLVESNEGFDAPRPSFTSATVSGRIKTEIEE